MSDTRKGGRRHDRGLNRREMLSLGALAGLSVVAGHVQEAGAETALAPAMPVVEVAPLAGVDPGAEIAFEYPDANSPAILLRLDGPVDGGVGPDKSIVAYSTLCTHKGCPVAYNSERRMLICPCHWSSFDPAKQGRMIIGQASQGLPQITLRVEAGMIQAIGVQGLIYGRHTNIL